jgi:ATP-dependent Clp protease ATP-binding subunit ClpA
MATEPDAQQEQTGEGTPLPSDQLPKAPKAGENVRVRLSDRLTGALKRRTSGLPPGMRAALSATGQDERFTERARNALTLADQEARALHHHYIGTEHLLLGLTVSGGVAAQVLEELEVTPEQARDAVAYVIGRGEGPTEGDLHLTPRAKQVLALAVEEAGRLGHLHIGTEHLLLALVVEGEGVAAGVMEKIGAGLERVRAKVVELTTHGAYAPEPMGTKDSVITCRTDPADLWAIDLLIEAGIRSTRSDAAQWLIHAGIEANRSLFDQVQGTVAEIRRLRDQARHLAAGSSTSARPTGQ